MPYADHAAKIAHDRDYYAKNAERVKARESAKYKSRREEIRSRRKELWADNRAKCGEYQRRRYAQLRADVLKAYGSVCACCGEDTPEFLELDHANNDGAAHRKQIGRGARQSYLWLRSHGFPKDGFQLLCANCNQGKVRNGGVCPHKTR